MRRPAARSDDSRATGPRSRAWRSRPTAAPSSPDPQDKTARLWDASTGRELCQLVSFNDGTWAVVDPSGRYDASNGGRVDGLHWVVGNRADRARAAQGPLLRPRPARQALELSREPLRSVDGLGSVRLHPQTELVAPDPGDPKGTLGITLTDRGGGIGRVVVKINGKEVAADARGASPDTRPRPEVMRLAVPLAGDPRLIPGKANRVEVLAYNADGSLRSRGNVVELMAEGPAERPVPELWAVVVGGRRLHRRQRSTSATPPRTPRRSPRRSRSPPTACWARTASTSGP